MTIGEKFLEGLNVSVICMGIVFLVLIGLIFVIMLQRTSVARLEGIGKKKASAAETPKVERTVAEENDNEELIAVISAAVAAALGRPASYIIVRSIRRLEPGTPSWAVAGRQDQINSRF